MKKIAMVLFLITIFIGCADFVDNKWRYNEFSGGLKCIKSNDCIGMVLSKSCVMWFDLKDCSPVGRFCASTVGDILSNETRTIVSGKRACLENK